MTNRALQRKIFVGCRELGLDDDARHDLQLAATGKDSLSDMTEVELQQVLDRLKECGFKPVSTGGKRRKTAPRADLRFVHVMWRLLGDAGALKRPDRDGLNAFIRSQFEGKWDFVPIDVDALRRADQISDVIEALKDMCRRNGVELKR